jgi:hypothetical protein
LIAALCLWSAVAQPAQPTQWERGHVIDGRVCETSDFPAGRTAVVYSFHQCEGDALSESWVEGIPASVESLRKHHPDVVVMMVTNVKLSDSSALHAIAPMFDRIVNVDLLQLAGLQPFYLQLKAMATGTACPDCGTE